VERANGCNSIFCRFHRHYIDEYSKADSRAPIFRCYLTTSNARSFSAVLPLPPISTGINMNPCTIAAGILSCAVHGRKFRGSARRISKVLFLTQMANEAKKQGTIR